MSDAPRRTPGSKAAADAPRHAASTATPRVTVGLAVYNGENFLEAAVQSILAQSYTDFELVICDNCSTDSTESICRRFAALDRRVRYYRNPFNVGGVRNENRTMFLARGTYFKLAAHDDRMAPRCLELCVRALDDHPTAEVCTTGVVVIDASDQVLEVRVPRAGTESRPHERIRPISEFRYGCEASYGLMRMETLREVRPQTNHLHSDRVVLCELALRQPFHVIEEPLFFKRIHEGTVYRDWRGRMAWYQPDLAVTGSVRMPHWLQAIDYIAMLGRLRMPLISHLRCAVAVLGVFWMMRNNLAMDVVEAVVMTLKGRSARLRRYRDEAGWR